MARKEAPSLSLIPGFLSLRISLGVLPSGLVGGESVSAMLYLYLAPKAVLGETVAFTVGLSDYQERTSKYLITENANSLSEKKTPLKCRMIRKDKSKLRVCMGKGRYLWALVCGVLQTVMLVHSNRGTALLRGDSMLCCSRVLVHPLWSLCPCRES